MANEADMGGWSDLLHSSSKLVEQAAPSAQFPPLQRNLDQLEALSKKLKSKTLRTEAPSQSIAATRLLAREGLNAEQLARDLKSFELKTTFEDVFPAEATSVEEYLQQVHEMAMVSAVQEAQKDNVRSFNDYMMTVLEEDWQKEKRDFLQSISRIATLPRTNIGDSSTASSHQNQIVSFSRPHLSPMPSSKESALLADKPVAEKKAAVYAQTVKTLNDARERGLPFRPATAFKSAFESLNLNTSGGKSVSMQKIWHLIQTLVGEDSNSQQVVSKKMSLIIGARRHLEWGHEKYVIETIQSHPAQAALGGAVGKIQRIHAFLRIRLRDYGVLDFDAGDARRQPPVDTTWQQIYFCLRTGYYDEAKNVASSSRVSHQFAFQLNEWITTGGMVSAETAAAEECEKMLRMGDRVGRIAYDKKKLLLYAILSGSRRQIDRLLRELPTLFNTIEDFLWFKLCAVRDQPGGSSFVLNDGSSPYTLSDLQAYLNKFEPSYYTKNGKDPLVYPYVLLLSIQLLPAILYMCKDTGNEAYNVDVVHISIALGDHGILAEGFGAGQTSGVMDACAEASSLIRQYGALYLQHDDLSMALEYYAQAAGTMGGGQLSWTGRGNVHQQWQRTSMLKQLLLELLLRDGGIYLLLGSRGAGEEGELGRFLTDENSRQQFLLEAARQCQEAGLYEKSIEIQKRVGAFSAALDTINKCLSEAIGALSRGRMDGESRTAGLIHSGNELVESFKYYPEVRKDTCKACWKDEMGMAEIVSRKGRLLTTIGIVRDGKIYCSIEETLYMAEVGALHLLHDDICLSLGEIYKMLSQGRYGCCWESFVVYKHLKSLGYIVSRHGVPWTLSHLTKNDSILNEATTKTNLKSDSEYEDTVITIKLFKSMHIDKVKPVFDVYAHNSKFRKSSPGNPNFVLCLTSSLPPSKQEISDLERRCSGIPLKLCNVEHGRVTFFSFNTVELPILP